MSLNKNKIHELYKQEILMDKPISIHGMKIHPVLVERYHDFMDAIVLFTLKKNYTDDIVILKMSYLEYMIEILKDDRDGYFKEKLINIFSCLLNIDKEEVDIYFHIDGKRSKIEVNNIILDRKQFDDVKAIALEVNIPEFDTEYMNPELEKALKERDELLSSGKKKVGIEERILIATHNTGNNFKDVMSMSIRKLNLLLRMMDKKERWKIVSTASLSGFVKIEGDITHYLEEDIVLGIEGRVVDYEAIKGKIQNAN